MCNRADQPNTSHVELFILAHEERRKRWDWDYAMCTLIRAWEKRFHQKLRDEMGQLPIGAMSWYHWHEALERAFHNLTDRIGDFRDAVTIGGPEATEQEQELLWKANAEVMAAVAAEASRSWKTMFSRLAEHDHRPPSMFYDAN